MAPLTEEQKRNLSPEDLEFNARVRREREERASRPVKLSQCPFCEEMKPRRYSDTYACDDCIGKAKNYLGEALEIGFYDLEGGLTFKNLVTGERLEEPESLARTEVYIGEHGGHVHGIRSGGVAVVFVR